MSETQSLIEALQAAALSEKPDVHSTGAAALPTLVAPKDTTVDKDSKPVLQAAVKQRSSSRPIKCKKFYGEDLQAPPLTSNPARPLLREVPHPSSNANSNLLTKNVREAATHIGRSAPKTDGVRPRRKRPNSYLPGRRRTRKSKLQFRKWDRLPRNYAKVGLGRWKPIDDYKLIENVLQTSDLSVVHLGTVFSCAFTYQEVKQRWCALLYDSHVSRTATAAMLNIHPEMKATADRYILYSDKEEELLSRIKSTDTPMLEDFQKLLVENKCIFHASRTAKRLQKHWKGMQHYQLLCDQRIGPAQALSFSDAEELLRDNNVLNAQNEELEKERQLWARGVNQKTRILESEIKQLNVLVDRFLGVEKFATSWDKKTLAAFRGQRVSFIIRSNEVSFGRSTDNNEVDMNLSLEGIADKISRRQGTIRLRSNGDFFICNEGNRAIFVNGEPLVQGQKTRLTHNSVVNIHLLYFVFLVNLSLIDEVRKQSATYVTPLA